MKELYAVVGTNPLPVYVAISHFGEKFDNIYLICSDENVAENQQPTEQYAIALREVLFGKFGAKINHPPIKLENISSIKLIKQELAKSISGTGNEIHVNYTAGTKVMSIAVHDFFKSNRSGLFTLSYSYLNARTYRMIIEDGQTISHSHDLRDSISITIQDILKLHNYNESHSSLDPHDCFKIQLHFIRQQIVEDKIQNLLDEWISPLHVIYRDYLRNGNNVYRGRDKLRKYWGNPIAPEGKTEEKSSTFNTFIKSKMDDFNQSLKLPENQNIIAFFINNGTDSILNKNNDLKGLDEIQSGIKGLSHPLDFLFGKWLECIVAESLINIYKKSGIQNMQYGLSLNPKLIKSDAQGIVNKDFELDAYVIYGYQLVGISVTTDSSSHAKQKAFEVIHRSRQIGGDEAKSILICAQNCDDAKELEQNVKNLTGSTASHFKVLGMDKWKTLEEEIQEFIFGLKSP